jgi:LPS-assembly lipoprotein
MQPSIQQGFRAAPLISLVVVLLLLQACGFRLRGAPEIPPAMQQAVVQGVAPYSELGLALSREWTRAGGNLDFAGERTDAVRLVISRDEISRRALSVDSAGRPTEYELQYTLVFAMQDAGGNSLLNSQTIKQYRAYRFDPDNVLAKSDEEARIKKDMVRQAVSQMLQRITYQLNHSSPATTMQPETTTSPADETAP